MTRTVAVILLPGGDCAAVKRMVAGAGGRFRVVVLGPPEAAGEFAEVAFRAVVPAWRLGSPARRYGGGVARVLRELGPAVIEEHDALEVATMLGGVFRPVPVVLVVHSDPQAQPGTRDAAGRTFLLAQVTRVAALSTALRVRVLDGVHPSMRQCALLPTEGPALADALDALRADELEAWSRTLGGPIYSASKPPPERTTCPTPSPRHPAT